ncbi:MAG: hypothetical protein ACLRFL_00065, partial [Clostridia bacterium]
TKKKISGQTIAIIALVILLLLTIGFGAVYAYFSTKSNSITGHVTMATLSIRLHSEGWNEELGGISEKSEITLSSTNVLPNQQLLNDPLIVKNSSEAPVCLIVVYEVSATRGEGTNMVKIQDDYEGCLIDLGVDYINSKHNPELKHDNEQTTGTEDLRRNTRWVDYLFTYEHPETHEESVYRCLVSLDRYTATTVKEGDKVTVIEQRIDVIEKDSLKLHQDLDNDYQTARLTFAFQAYVIGASDDWYNGLQTMSVKDQCEEIVGRTYQNQNYQFLNVALGVN